MSAIIRTTSATVLALGISALVLGGSSAAQAQPAAPTSAVVPTSEAVMVGCNAGDWRGDAVVSWSWDDHRFTAEVLRYKIRESPWESGGNRANVNLGLDILGGSGWTDEGWVRSPDAMKQDNQWHDLGLAFPARQVPLQVETSVEFIFDRSGQSDPRCQASFITAPNAR